MDHNIDLFIQLFRHRRGSTAHFGPWSSGYPSSNHFDPSITLSNFEIRPVICCLRQQNRPGTFGVGSPSNTLLDIPVTLTIEYGQPIVTPELLLLVKL